METKELERKLLARNIQPTSIRLLILDMLDQEKEALGLSDLESRLTRSDRTTLYRTLKTFHEHGLVHQVHDETGTTKYALCRDDCSCTYPDDMHVHFHCSACDRTYCFPHLAVPNVALPDQFNPSSVNFVISGTCDTCSS